MSDETEPLTSGPDSKPTSRTPSEHVETHDQDEIVSRIQRALLGRRRLRIGASEAKGQASLQPATQVDVSDSAPEEPLPVQTDIAVEHQTGVVEMRQLLTAGQATSASTVDHKPILADSSTIAKVVDGMMSKALQMTPGILEACTKAVQVAESKREATTRDYQEKFTRLTRTLGDPGRRANVDDWLMTLAPYHGAANSFKAYRAALCHGLRQRIRELLTLQEELSTNSGFTPDWLDVVARLKAFLRILEAVKAASHGAEFWKVHGGKKRTGTRKGVDLRKLVKLYPNWRAEFLAAMTRTKYKDAAHVSDLVGCRPQELVNGAVVRRVDDHSFSITIQGAKVSERSGQEWRTLVFANRVLPACWSERLQDDGEIRVSIDSVAAYRQSEKRVSARLFPKAPNVTPYTFRHAFRTQQAEEGGEEVEIGAAMGHSSAESQFAYGSPPAKGKKRIKPAASGLTAVQSARPVKTRDKTGLQTFLNKKGRPDA